MILLEELEQDALKEIFNVGVGYAADSLSRMVQDEVRLAVPEIRTLTMDQLGDVFVPQGAGGYCAVLQRFEGPLRANALLMFPGERSLELVRVMLGQSVPVSEMGELEQEALTEVGNILLNSCVSVISDMLGTPFRCSMPEYVSGRWGELLEPHRQTEEFLLLLNIDFTIERRQIKGYLVFLMHLDSLEEFRMSIRRFLGQIG